MPLVALSDATFDFGRERVLHRVDLTVEVGVKYALVGANGTGKTTLLRALAGQLELEAGRRSAIGGLRFGYLRQEAALAIDAAGVTAVNAAGTTSHAPTGETAPVVTVRDAVAAAAFAHELELERDLAELSQALHDADPAEQARLVERQGRMQSEFERLDGYTLRARLDAALRGVGLRASTWHRTLTQLSGGERRRAALAAILLGQHDLLLLDEPTNHLDLESCEWLEAYLEQYSGAAVLVSHDRYFLDRLCKRTWHLEGGRLTIYSGGYSFFDEQRSLRYEQDLAAWENQQTKIRQAEDYIARNIAGQKTKQAQSRRKQLAKMDRVEKPLTEPGLFRFRIETLRPSGGTILQAEGLRLRYDSRTLFADLDLMVVRGDRVGIIGPNGCGKTTLLQVLAGMTMADGGRVMRGHNVDLGVYDQELSGVVAQRTPLQELHAVDPVTGIADLRSYLGAFGFATDLHERAVGDLSGGQRSRLALLKLVKQGYNTLLLDEPTNHLDTRSRESLEGALDRFDGTLVVVSHDRRFLDKLVNRLVIFPPADADPEVEPVRVFLGNYSDWMRHRATAAAAAADAAAATKAGSRASAGSRAGAGASPGGRRRAPAGGGVATSANAGGPRPLSKNEQARRRDWIAGLEEEIAAIEAEKAAAVTEMAHADLSPERRLELGRRCVDLDADLEAKLAHWERWSRELEEGVVEP